MKGLKNLYLQYTDTFLCNFLFTQGTNPAPKISNFINVYLYSEGRHENLKFSPLEGHDSPIRNVSQHDNQTDEHIL